MALLKQDITSLSNGEMQDNCLLRLEMQDGSVQIVQFKPYNIPNTQNTNKTIKKKPSKNYRVVFPNELQLHPVTSHIEVKCEPKVKLPRGRPRKLNVDPLKEEVDPRVDPIKDTGPPTRTRSGRITRPPVHMEKDFKKIIVNEKVSQDISDVSAVEFEPLKTGNCEKTADAPKLVSLAPKRRKVLIPGQYRCRTCKKAYLGRNKMASHLKKYPDHGVINHLNMEDSEAWSFLVDIALKAKEGQKGIKFCKELLHLVKCARTLAKYFFKPAKDNRIEYTVDPVLASILNIDEGGYRFNENELCKDLGIFSFLDYIDCSFSDVQSDNFLTDKTPPKIAKVADSRAKDIDNEFIGADYNFESKNQICHRAKIDLHFGSEMMDVLEETAAPNYHTTSGNVKTVDIYRQHLKPESNLHNNSSPAKEKETSHFEDNSVKNDEQTDNFITLHKIKISDATNKNQTESTESFSAFNATPSDDSRTNFQDIISLQSKETCNDNDEASSHNSISLSSNQNDRLICGLVGKRKDKKSTLQKVQDDFDLNKLHLDEFMLTDGSNNILESSASSDDIMNVDQFVYERFKKITESDELHLPNTSLNLDLPSLDCFNFNT